MATYYVDFNQNVIASSTGVLTDPFNASEFVHRVSVTGDPTDIYYVKGYYINETSTSALNILYAAEIRAWDTTQLGGIDKPWGIRVASFYINNTSSGSSTLLEGGILQSAPLGSELTYLFGDVKFHNIYFAGDLRLLSHPNSAITTTYEFKGCTLTGNRGDFDYLVIENLNSPIDVTIIDSYVGYYRVIRGYGVYNVNFNSTYTSFWPSENDLNNLLGAGTGFDSPTNEYSNPSIASIRPEDALFSSFIPSEDEPSFRPYHTSISSSGGPFTGYEKGLFRNLRTGLGAHSFNTNYRYVQVDNAYTGTGHASTADDPYSFEDFVNDVKSGISPSPYFYFLHGTRVGGVPVAFKEFREINAWDTAEPFSLDILLNLFPIGDFFSSQKRYVKNGIIQVTGSATLSGVEFINVYLRISEKFYLNTQPSVSGALSYCTVKLTSTSNLDGILISDNGISGDRKYDIRGCIFSVNNFRITAELAGVHLIEVSDSVFDNDISALDGSTSVSASIEVPTHNYKGDWDSSAVIFPDYTASANDLAFQTFFTDVVSPVIATSAAFGSYDTEKNQLFDASRLESPGPLAYKAKGVGAVSNNTIFSFGTDAASAFLIEGNTTYEGVLQEFQQSDWFKIRLFSGNTYTIEESGALAGIPLSDTFLTLIDTDGITVLAQDDDGGVGTDSRIDYAITATGDYYVVASSYTAYGYDEDIASLGGYTLSVTGTFPVPPIASFYANVTQGTINPGPIYPTIDFIDDSSGDISSYLWDFGDGDTSTDQDPSHTYTNPGLYTVSLTATGPAGSDTQTRTEYITIYPIPLSVNFTGTPVTGVRPLSVAFNATIQGNPFSQEWDFGDGSTSTALNPSHQYLAAGSYTVSLSVVGEEDPVTGIRATDTETKVNYITASVPPPTADFVGSPQSGNVPLSVNFTSNSSGDITSHSWSFGDGDTSTQENPVHVYSASGTYTVSLTVTGPGGSDTETKTAYISVTNIIPDFSYAPSEGVVPLLVQFEDTSTGSIVSYDWDFGDGSPNSSAQNPSHTYNTNDLFNVTLTVTYTDTTTNSVTKQVRVKPRADFSGTPLSGDLPLTVSFTNSSQGTITSYLWTFGDGFNSTEVSPSHTYSSKGTYTVSLKVTDAQGSTHTRTLPDYITVDYSGNFYYVDLEETTLGLGTSTSPYTYAQFIAASDDTLPYLFRGKKTLVITEDSFEINKPTFLMRAWDLGAFGPWRINVILDPSIREYLVRVKECSEGIINAVKETSEISVNEDDNFDGTTLKDQWDIADLDQWAGSSVSVGGGLLTISARGKDVWESETTLNDDYVATYLKEVPGDFVVSTKINSQDPVHPWSKAGILLKDDIIKKETPNTGYALVCVAPGDTPGTGKRLAFQVDSDGDGYIDNSQQLDVVGIDYPIYLKMSKSGNTVRGEYSSDGVSWDFIGEYSFDALASIQDVGLFNVSHDETQTCVATYDEWKIEEIEGIAFVKFQSDSATGEVEYKSLHVHTSSQYVQYYYDVKENMDFLGSSIINTGKTAEGAVIRLQSTFKIKDSIVDFKDMALIDTLMGIIETDNCVFNYNGDSADFSSDSRLPSFTFHENPQFDFTVPEDWPSWDAGANASGVADDPDQWAKWSLWSKFIQVGTGSYLEYFNGLFGEVRLGVGALYFDHPYEDTFSVSKPAIEVLETPIKTSTAFTAIGWIKNPIVENGSSLIPLAVSDLYGDVINTEDSIFFELLKEGLDYRLKFSNSKSKLVNKTLKIDLGDKEWHMISYVCLNNEGDMLFYVDAIPLDPEIGSTEDNIPFSKGYSTSVRKGGGDVWCPYLYQNGTSVTSFNWRLGVGFSLSHIDINNLFTQDKNSLNLQG